MSFGREYFTEPDNREAFIKCSCGRNFIYEIPYVSGSDPDEWSTRCTCGKYWNWLMVDELEGR